MERILITGIDGFLGGKLTKKILEETDNHILGLTLSQEFADRMVSREGIENPQRIHFLTNDEFLATEGKEWKISGAVHLAFARRNYPAADIASSIVFASNLFHKLAAIGADRIINMSTQGVYGNTEEIRTEETVPAPATQYTMAKYAAEVLFNDILRDVPHHTNFRLDPVAQSQNVLQGLCKSAKEGIIQLKGGKQLFSFIDAEEVPAAILAMLQAKGDWNQVYNVGWNKRQYTLVELAELVANTAEEAGYPRPSINLESSDMMLWAGMDSSRFTEKTGWRPEIGLDKTIRKML